MPDPSGLYPQPPQPGAGQQNMLNNPLGLVGAMQQIQGFRARQAVGQAYQNAIQPDGSIDQNAFITGVKNDPNATLAAPEAGGTALEQRIRTTESANQAFQLAHAQNSAVQDFVSSVAQNPNLTPDQVRSMAVDYSKRTNIPSAIWTSVLQGMPSTGGKALQNWARNYQLAQIGAARGAEPIEAGVTPQGVPIRAPFGGVTAAGGAFPTALPPGQPELFAANRAELGRDQTGSAALLQGLRPLQQALPLVEQLSNRSFGPQSAGWAKFKGSLQEAGIIKPDTTDTEVYQEANKYLKQNSLAAPGATRSNEGLETAIKARPDLDLTQGANLKLIKNQIGFDRMDATLPIAFKQQHPNPADDVDYKTFKTQFYQTHDPRAYSFDVMNPAEQQDVIKSLGPKPTPGKPNPVYTKFMNSLKTAHQAGVLTPQGGGGGGGQ